MRKLFTWLLIIGVGAAAFTLGSKAGRSRYRYIRATAEALWNDPQVRKARRRIEKRADKAVKKAVKQLG
jgi:hypothetical protein